jgi:hypothetical protein
METETANIFAACLGVGVIFFLMELGKSVGLAIRRDSKPALDQILKLIARAGLFIRTGFARVPKKGVPRPLKKSAKPKSARRRKTDQISAKRD